MPMAYHSFQPGPSHHHIRHPAPPTYYQPRIILQATAKHCHFHATNFGRILQHSDAACRLPSIPLGIHAGNNLTPLTPLSRPNSGNRRRTAPNARHTANPSIHNDVTDTANKYIPDYTDDEGKHRIILDSATHPTQHHLPVASTPPLPTPQYTKTSKRARSPITPTGHVAIQHARHRFLTPAVISSEINDTEVSVRDAAGRGHCKIFTQMEAHRVPLPSIAHQLSENTHIAQ